MRSDPIRILFCSALGMLVAASAPAAITTVTSVPDTARAGFNQATSLTLNWTVVTNSVGSVTVTSSQGLLLDPDGGPLATVAQPLSQPVTGPGTVAFREGFLVPADVIARAHRAGHDHIFYRRSFSDGVTLSGQVRIDIATARGATFGISQVELAFVDGGATRVVRRGARLRAYAMLAYTGAGRIEGAWEIAGPDPDGERPAWRVLAPVVQVLAGTEAARLTAPALPADSPGAYLIRLRVREPAVGFALPTLRYQVIVGEENPQ